MIKLFLNSCLVRINKLFQIFFYFFCFTIPLNQSVSIKVLVATLILSFFVRPDSSHNSHNYLKGSWDIVLYLLVLLIGLAYTEDLILGFRVIETNFSFLAIPIVIGRLSAIDGKGMKVIFTAFIVGLVVASIICFTYAIFRFIQNNEMQVFFFDNFTEPIYSHPTYFAYYLIFAISVKLYFLFYGSEEIRPILSFALILFLFFALILTGGQTAFISLLFVFSFFILKFFTEEKSNEKIRFIMFIALMLCCMFLIIIVEKDNRVLIILNDSWERAVLWESAVAAVPNPLLGVGTGDYKIALNDYYTTNNLSQFASESYNAHNQLLQLLFSNGILGVIAFCIMLGRPLYRAFMNRNILAVLCLFPFLIYGMTEVFLGRYQGVVFFALLHQLFSSEMNSETQRLQTPK